MRINVYLDRLENYEARVSYKNACEEIGIPIDYLSKWFYGEKEGWVGKHLNVFKVANKLIETMYDGDMVLDAIYISKNSYNGGNDVVFQLKDPNAEW